MRHIASKRAEREAYNRKSDRLASTQTTVEAEPHTGVIYSDESTEIVSMELEQLFNNPVEFAVNDPRLFDFIIENICVDDLHSKTRGQIHGNAPSHGS